MAAKLEVCCVDLAEGEQLEGAVNEDIRAFDTFFQSLGNDPMVRSEVAIIKTYLHYKLKGEKHGPATGG